MEEAHAHALVVIENFSCWRFNMVDISMCINETCKKKAKCYRYNAVQSYRQSFCAFSIDKHGNCDGFVPMDGENNGGR